MTLSPTALAAAAKAIGERIDAADLDSSRQGSLARTAVTAYLAALPPIDAAELVERLNAERQIQVVDYGNVSAACSFDEAADTITRLSREVEEMRGKRS